MKRITFTLISFFFAYFASAQEEAQWTPQVNFTGYVNVVTEGVDLPNWKDADKNFAMGLSEASFLVNYQPLKNLKFQGTFVYNHYMEDIKSLFVELYGTYKYADYLQLSAGKFLTPLSPVNQYFFAPMNPGATLPMLVSHHAMYPQSISGLKVSGVIGNDIKAGYDFAYGNYNSETHVSTSMIGVQGMEDFAGFLTENPPRKPVYYLGGSARIYGSAYDVFHLGLNYFDGRQSVQYVQEMNMQTGSIRHFDTKAQRYSTGVDMQVKAAGFKLNAEYWVGKAHTTTLPTQINNTFQAYYAELIYETGIFSPYVRYDYVDDVKSTVFAPFPTNQLFTAETYTDAYTIGLAVRPIYEILVKAEYRKIKCDYLDNPLQIQIDDYNHYIISLVYSF